MTNYDGEKHKRLGGLIVPKTKDGVALASTNSDGTEDKEEPSAGTNSGETENKEITLSGSNSVEEEPKSNEPSRLEKDIEETVEKIKRKSEEPTSRNEHGRH